MATDPGNRAARADESAITQIHPALAGITPRVLLVDDDGIAVERMRFVLATHGVEA